MPATISYFIIYYFHLTIVKLETHLKLSTNKQFSICFLRVKTWVLYGFQSINQLTISEKVVVRVIDTTCST